MIGHHAARGLSAEGSRGAVGRGSVLSSYQAEGPAPHHHLRCLRTVAIALFWAAAITCFTIDAAAGQPDQSDGDLTNLSLKELMEIRIATVYGASRFEQKVTEAPSSVTIITADDIRKYGYRTLADILRSVRSLQITYDRNYSYIGVRGFGRTGDYNGRILLLVDGHRINDNIYDSALIGTEFPLDVDLIDRVEIIRGPGSSLYGNNAFLAVINILTRKAESFKGAEVSGSAGSFRTYAGRASYGNLIADKASAVFSASALDSKGPHRLFYKEYAAPETNNGYTIDTDYDRNHSLFFKADYCGFTLESLYGTRDKGMPTGSFGADFNDRRNRTTDERGFVYLKYEHLFRDGGSLMGRIYYDSYKYRGTYIYSGLVTRDYADGQWVGAETVFSRKLFSYHKVTAGVEYQVNIKQNQGNYDVSPYNINLDDRRRSKKWAVYAQDEYNILRNLILNAGVRYDYLYSYGSTINPRLALIYAPAAATAVKLLYGTAFRAPNVYELYYADNLLQGANPSLKPEKITTYEAVIEQYFGKSLRGTAAVFHNGIRDLIEQQTDPDTGLLVFRNTDKIVAKGLEFELEGVWDGGYKIRASYTVQKAKDLTDGDIPVNSPKHLAKLNVTFPVWSDKVFAGIEEQFSSRRRTIRGNMTDNVYVTNVTVFTQKVLRNLEFSASIYNLFGNKYGDPGAEEHLQDIIKQDGRAYRAKVTYKF